MHERENALKEWLKQSIKHHDFTFTPLTGDASFRKYYRVEYQGITRIVMDAPPEKEDILPFIHITGVLDKENIPTPKIIAQDSNQGFLLLSDLGDVLLLKKLHIDTADDYYRQAITILLRMQQCSINDPKIPSFDQAFMLKEMKLCSEWFLSAYLKLELTDAEHLVIENTMNWIAEQVAQQPIVFIHRDYHSRNIMLTTNEEGTSLVVIDYQDAMRGPLTYDLVSLLKDCYIAWPRERVLEWADYFYRCSELARTYTKEQFIRAFDLCGLQRHLKVLGVFSRLYLRDGKSGYLADLPLTLHYALECAERYNELHAFCALLKSKVSL